jgi:cell division septum initiation protein DivIVA
MADPVKTQAKMDKARLRAEVHLETARAKAERKVARARADLAVTEAKIQARLKKALRKGNGKLTTTDAASLPEEDPAASAAPRPGRLPRAPRS